MSDLFKDCKDIPLHHSILRNVVDKVEAWLTRNKVEAKKRLLLIDTTAEMHLSDLSESPTPTGKKDADCIVCVRLWPNQQHLPLDLAHLLHLGLVALSGKTLPSCSPTTCLGMRLHSSSLVSS